MSKPVGYECEFVDQVPEDYFCRQCKHVAREPSITSCCAEVLCKGCVDLILQDKEPCPSCDNEIKPFCILVNYHHKILALEVHCAMKDRGCQWTGRLQHLDAHLHVTNGDCQYVDVDCPKQCGQKVQKHNVDTHLADHCTNRDHRCQHCNFKDAGCETKFIRDNEDEHMEQNTQKHLALMAATTLRISQNFERKLQEQQQDFQHKQELFEKKLQDKSELIKAVQLDLERKLQEQQKLFEGKLQNQQEVFEKKLQDKDKQIKAVQEQLQTTSQTLKQQQQDSFSEIRREVGILPHDFTLSNYQQLKTSNSHCDSPPICTHPNGYRFELKIYPTGVSSGEGTHVSVYVFSLESNYDAVLKFPVQFTITLQLLNQYRDQDHHTREIQCDIMRRGDVGDDVFSIGSDSTTILHADLEWNADNQTQYLKDDCLRFRITKIVLQ